MYTRRSTPIPYYSMYITPRAHFASVEEAKGAIRAVYYCCLSMTTYFPGSIDKAFTDELAAAETFRDVCDLFDGWFIVTRSATHGHYTATFRVGGRVQTQHQFTPGSQATQPPDPCPIFSGTGS